MAFLTSETGLERGGTTLVFDREPRDLNRNNASGPARVKGFGLTGRPITVEYHQDPGIWLMKLALEQLTAAKVAVLRGLADDPGPLTLKRTGGVATTYTVTIASIEFDPIIGHFTDGAPESIKYERVELELAVQEVIP